MPDKHFDLLIIGHLSKDIIIIDGERSDYAVGGSAYYAAFAAQPAGIDLLVVTKLAIEDCEILGDFWRHGLPVLPLFCEQTTVMEDIFEKQNNYSRRSRLISSASAFSARDIPVQSAEIFLFSGLLYGEVPEPLIEDLSGRGKVALDAQTFVRRLQGDEVVHRDWRNKERYLRLIDFFKADLAEAKILTGEDSLNGILEKLHGWGVGEVMVTGDSGVTVSDGTERLFAPFPTYTIESRSGRGDTCFASYLSWRIHHSLTESIDYAAKITAKKLQRPGPYAE